MKKKLIYILILSPILGLIHSCNYLDVVPDNVATIDHAFATRDQAEKFLFTCYSYIPNMAHPNNNVGLMGADELWTSYQIHGYESWNIARVEQNVNDPFLNYWEGRRGGTNLYNAIRDCNIFLENIVDTNKAPELNETMRNRWISEVTFLKAFYHFYLFRMYGPIVIVDKNLPISSTPEKVKAKRMPVDSVVNYIARLYDQSMENLPESITEIQSELGRITRPGVLAIKARLLVTAASPLFNGYEPYRNFKDKDGIRLFSDYDFDKWERAVQACDSALRSCSENGIGLYDKLSDYDLRVGDNEVLKRQLVIRNSFARDGETGWSSDIIWGLSGRHGNDQLQTLAMARLDPANSQNVAASREELNPPIEITNLFYTKEWGTYRRRQGFRFRNFNRSNGCCENRSRQRQQTPISAYRRL
ncbi:RagB/SusD family nutrient uptake outer membrane protein [termite gut metagenome]|uniref:RagB/SusD family nutrient uptake outer membrane protein n=1 Tax=termite gut metagenome TaxID=433724 RepID=A0A5J4RG15_9ZZZZ